MKLSVLKFIAMLVITAVTVFYIDARINAYDMRFYAGKDNGLGARVLSILFLSALFFAVMTEKYRILMFVIGFGVGFASSILGYFLCGLLGSSDLIFHSAACVIFSSIYFLLKQKFSELCRKVLLPFSSK